MMGLRSQTKSCCLIFVICFSLFTTPPASTFISDVVFVSGRRLLQAKKPCTVDFQSQNYTILTSQCKEPYSPGPCCSAFKELACPFANELNDLTTECAEVMFSYITREGNYPPALFASLCREGKDGLQCPPEPPSSSLSEEDNINSGIRIICQVLMITIAALLQFI